MGHLNMKASAMALAAAFAAPAASAISGTYKGSVPFILDMTIIFPGDGTMNFDQNVKVASTEVKCPAEKIAETDAQITFPNSAADGDCLGDHFVASQKILPSSSLTSTLMAPSLSRA